MLVFKIERKGSVMRVSKIIVKKARQLGFHFFVICEDDIREIDVSALSCAEIIRVFTNECLKLYAEKVYGDPNRLVRVRASSGFSGVRWSVNESSVELA